MSVKLAVISQTRLSRLLSIEQRENSWNSQFELHEFIAEQHHEKLVELDKRRDIEVFVAGGGNAAMIASMQLDTPLVSIKVSGFDIMQALWRAQSVAKKAVFINYIEPIEQLERFASLFKIEVEQHTFNSVTQAVDTVLSVVQQPDSIIIGASHVCDIAQSMQANSVFIYSQDSIHQALSGAEQLALSLHAERIKREKLEAILRAVHDGIIYIDEHANVEELNPAAESILGIKAKDTLNLPIAKVIPNSQLEKVFRTGQSQYNQVLKIGDTQILSNRVAVFNQGKIIGALASFQDAKNIRKAEQSLRVNRYAKGLVAKYSLGHYIGENPIIKKILTRATHFANTDASILIQGETGTGKELIAQGIHLASHRALGPFVAINCASIPESLLESTLFGYDEGAFTGANKNGKTGLFELADKGTIFLDEIGELPLKLQGRLLRVLQEKQVMRLGSDTLLNIDVRVISASNRNLLSMVKNNSFKDDLFYRLNVLSISLPSLKERLDDLPLFVAHFFKRHEVPQQQYSTLIAHAMPALLSYSWPGNIRELENLVERTAILLKVNIAEPEILQEINESLGLKIYLDEPVANTSSLGIKDIEQQHLQTVLQASNNNRSIAAKKLGISRSTLWRKLKTR